MRRKVNTPLGELEYTLNRKRVKNLNLRLDAQGQPQVSAPRWVAAVQVDAFVQARAQWIARAQQHWQAARAAAAALPPPPGEAVCREIFRPALERYAPLFSPAIGGPLQLRIKPLRSMWGVCRPAKRQITLSSYLALQAPELVEYVVLHEYLHFWHPDHGPAFHAALDALMPDNRQRRKRLPQIIRSPQGGPDAERA